MNFDRVNSRRDLPNDFNVIVEIPMNADPIKYEVNKDSSAMFVDRFIATAEILSGVQRYHSASKKPMF